MSASRWAQTWPFAAGLLIGCLLGPAVAWAAERVEVNWPNVFRIEAYRTLPVQVEQPVNVRIDRYSNSELGVKITSMPRIEIEGGRGAFSTAPSFAPLTEGPGYTLFVVGRPDGRCSVMKLWHATGQVTVVSWFRM